MAGGLSESGSRVYGESERPRILLHRIPVEFHQSYHERFPTVRAVENLGEVEEAEFDVLVTTRNAAGADDHLRVIVFRSSDIGAVVDIARSKSGNHRNVIWRSPTKARQFHLPEAWHPDVARFIQERLLPLASGRSTNPVLGFMEGPSPLSPFLQTVRGDVLAARYPRSGGVDGWVFPPELVEYGAECTSIAVERWRKDAPERFPPRVEDWTKQARWQTASEELCTKELNELNEKRAQMLAKFRDEEVALETRLQEVRTTADAGERLLLTAQGDELVKTVQRCLEEFGFQVQYMDDVWQAGDRLEDLRVRLPADPDWIAIAEVRGYKNGAAMSDLVRLIGRFRSRYLREVGTLPSCSWYIANAYIPKDPAERPPILHTNDAEVEAYGEDDTLIVATVSLYEMLMDHQRGFLTTEEARGRLRESRGRLTYTRHLAPKD